jgi:hypothetical protein
MADSWHPRTFYGARAARAQAFKLELEHLLYEMWQVRRWRVSMGAFGFRCSISGIPTGKYRCFFVGRIANHPTWGRVSLHCRFRKRGTGYFSKSSINWMSSSAKPQRDRTLRQTAKQKGRVWCASAAQATETLPYAGGATLAARMQAERQLAVGFGRVGALRDHPSTSCRIQEQSWSLCF